MAARSSLLMVLLLISTKGTNRYFMDDDNDQGLTALPIDLCFEAISYPNVKYMKYVCSDDGTTVTKIKYSDSSCSNPTSISYFNGSHAESPCGLYNFECNGDDRYVMTGAFYEYLSKDKNCQSLQAELPTVLGCFCTSDTTSFKASCTNESSGFIETYSDSQCKVADDTRQLSECKLEMKVDIAFYSVRIYSKITQCVNPNDEEEYDVTVQSMADNSTDTVEDAHGSIGWMLSIVITTMGLVLNI